MPLSLQASATAGSSAQGGTSGPATTGDFTVQYSTAGNSGNSTGNAALYYVAAAAALAVGYYLWRKSRKSRK